MKMPIVVDEKKGLQKLSKCKFMPVVTASPDLPNLSIFHY